MSKSKPPKASAQELQLLESQKQMLDLQRQQLQQQSRREELLQPVMFAQMGIVPQYDAAGTLTGYTRQETPEQALYRQQLEGLLAQQPQQQAYQEKLLQLATQQAEYQATQQAWQQEFEPTIKAQLAQQLEFQKQAMDFQATQMQQMQEQQRLQPLLYEASGVRPIYDEQGKITSFQLTEEAQARKDFENQLIERQRKALAGELEADPVLERSLQEGEQQLRAKLQAQLGAGYETSTPGIQALQEFQRRAGEARSQVAHGQMVSAQNVLASQQALNERQFGGAYGGRQLLGQYGLEPVRFGQGVQAPTLGLFQAGSPGGYIGGLQSILGGGQAGGTLGSAAQGYGQLYQNVRQGRLQDYAMEEKLRNEYAGTLGQIGAAAGTIIGSVFAPGVGTAAGATLGGLAGSYAGRATY